MEDSFDSLIMRIKHQQRALTSTPSIDDESYHMSDEETFPLRREEWGDSADAFVKEIVKAHPPPNFKIS